MSGTLPPRLKTKAAELESELRTLYERVESNDARMEKLSEQIQKLGKEWRRLNRMAETMQAALTVRHPLLTRPWDDGRLPTTGATTYKGYHGVQAIENAKLASEYNEMSYKLWDVRKQLDYVVRNADTLKAELSRTRLQRMCTSASITVTEGKLRHLKRETAAIAKRIAASRRREEQGQAMTSPQVDGPSGTGAKTAGCRCASCTKATNRTASTVSGTALSSRRGATLPASAARIDMVESDDEELSGYSGYCAHDVSEAGSSSIVTSTSGGSATAITGATRIDTVTGSDTVTSSGTATKAPSVAGRNVSTTRHKKATRPARKANTARAVNAAGNAAANPPRTKTSDSATPSASNAEEPSSTNYEVGQLIWSTPARPYRRR